MRTSESTVKVVAALVTARGAFKPVIRDAVGQVGDHRQYKYADLAGILDATMPALLANELVVVQIIDAESATLITRLAHTSGEFIEATYPLKLDLAPQAFGSLLTYGRRYSLQSLLCLASEDDDGAAAQPTPSKRKPDQAAKTKPVVRVPKGDAISEPQRRRMFALAKEHGWSTDQMKETLLVTFGIESTKDLPSAKYDAVVQTFSVPPVAAADMPL